jgi:hypothetical protein
MPQPIFNAISPEMLHAYLNYDPDTGALTWKKLALRNRFKIGDLVGSPNKKKGRVTGMIFTLNGLRYYVHRAAWVMSYGDIPRNVMIDHINRDPTDNRLCNLRLSSLAQNVINRMRTGQHPMGVYKSGTRYMAAIQPPGKRGKLHLGSYDTPEEAGAAHIGASVVMHGEFSPFASRAAEHG